MPTLEEVKKYLRVEYEDDDTIIATIMDSAYRLCMDILRTDDETEFTRYRNSKVAFLYAVAYLYEHREEADHAKLSLSLRALLSGGRKAGF